MRKRWYDDLPDEPYEKRKKPWTKDRVLALCLQIFIVLAAVSGVIVYRWHKNRTEQFKTGVMDGGELCIAYKCENSEAGEKFILKGNSVTESMRFAFSTADGYMKVGRIYTPFSEGESELFTAHSERADTVIYEHITISVDSGLNVTFLFDGITKEEFESAVKEVGSQ